MIHHHVLSIKFYWNRATNIHLCIICGYFWDSLVFSDDSDVKTPPTRQENWLGKTHGEGDDLPTPVVLPGEFHGQRSLASYSPYTGSQRVRYDSVTNTWLLLWYNSRG